MSEQEQIEDKNYDEDLNPDEGFGFCPKCGKALSNWGAASHGDGDIFDEIGCGFCQEVIHERHATYCKCPDCQPYGNFEDDDEEEDF